MILWFLLYNFLFQFLIFKFLWFRIWFCVCDFEFQVFLFKVFCFQFLFLIFILKFDLTILILRFWCLFLWFWFFNFWFNDFIPQFSFTFFLFLNFCDFEFRFWVCDFEFWLFSFEFRFYNFEFLVFDFLSFHDFDFVFCVWGLTLTNGMVITLDKLKQVRIRFVVHYCSLSLIHDNKVIFPTTTLTLYLMFTELILNKSGYVSTPVW